MDGHDQVHGAFSISIDASCIEGKILGNGQHDMAIKEFFKEKKRSLQ